MMQSRRPSVSAPKLEPQVADGLTLRLRVEAADGSQQTIEVTDGDRSAVLRRVSARGWRVVSIERATQAPALSSGPAGRRFDLLLFNHELLALLEAGLNLNEALSTLYAKEKLGPSATVLGSMLVRLREGRNLSDVLEASAQYFPEVYVATVRASERSGDLPQALRRYLDYQMQFEAIRKKVLSASIYPVLLLAAGGLVTLFLLGYVVPRFSSIYESSGRSLPWLSTVLLQFGNLLYRNGALALGVASGAVIAAVWTASRPRGRAWMLNQVLRFPWLAERASVFRLARFYRAVSLLLSAGIPLPRALGMVAGLLSSDQQRRLADVRRLVDQGQPLSAALIAAGLATVVAESLIRVGERSGQLAEMLERTARFQDEDFGRWIEWFSRLLEPVLMAIIGLVVGAVVILMYVPIFDLAGSLQ